MSDTRPEPAAWCKACGTVIANQELCGQCLHGCHRCGVWGAGATQAQAAEDYRARIKEAADDNPS